jgi:uncharacterized coiled-coil protein SlyX
MQNRRDSSVWCNLAAAFGDGLAFGVGVALSRTAAHRAATRTESLELLPADDKPPDPEAVLTVIDARFTEIGGHIGKRLAELESKVRLDLDTVTAQARSQAEFAQILARRVDDQIATTIAARLQTVEERLRDTIREEIRLSGRDQQIAELRDRIERQERNLLNLVMALGQSCLQAAGHISPEPPPPAPTNDPELPALV